MARQHRTQYLLHMSLAAALPLTLSSAASAAPLATAQQARAERLRNDRLTVKLERELPRAQNPHDDRIEGTGDATLDAVLSAAGVDEVRRVFRQPPRGWRDPVAAREVGLDRWIEVRFAEDRADLAELREQLLNHGAVEVCDRVVEGYVADTVPNDPQFNQQWGLQTNRIGAPQAWDHQTTSTRIVAVLDTGTDLDHPDLQANHWINAGEIANNGIDDDNNGFIDDRRGWDFYYDDGRPEDKFGHGVHTAGTVGAVTNNSNQVAGVCWSVPIMNIQVFSDGGGGSHSICAAGMVYAADNGASVFSMSWGFFDDLQVLRDAVDYAEALNVVQVAAAHNFDSKTRMYPAAYPNVMGIIATNSADRRASFSNYGKWCDMAAPGEDILSTYLNGGTASLSGTSMATPHVAGAAALIWEINPAMDAVDTRRCLTYSAKDLGNAGFDEEFGWGRLDLFAAVKKAQSLALAQNVANPGDSVPMSLRFDSEPGFVHIVLPSRFGRDPGLELRGFDASDMRQIAINEDPLLFNLLFNNPTGFGVFIQFIGNLDASGKAQPIFNIPGGNLFAGLEFSFAAVTFDPANLTKVSSVSVSNLLRVQ